MVNEHGTQQQDAGLTSSGHLVEGTPAGIDPTEIERRSALAEYLGKEVWPADAPRLLEVARDRKAPDAVVAQLSSLATDQKFENLEQVWQALGGGREQRD